MTGGSGSGKSAFAERVAAALSRERTYVATMAATGAEARQRIERHRRQRAHLGFTTLECPDTLAGVPASPGVTLVDDLGNLCANALFAPDGTMAPVRAVRDRLVAEFEALCRRSAHVVVVSVEAGCAGRPTDAGTAAWTWLNGAVAAELGARLDVVCELSSGIPLVLKGDLPCL